MIIRKIEIEGFRSIKHLVFDFADSGIWSIQGENGAGKSTIFEALYYSLYGDTVKDTVVADIPTLKKYRDSEFKGTMVSITFSLGSDDYEIYRTIDYGPQRLSDIVIMKNGNSIPTSSRAEAQQVIDSIVGVTQGLFKNSVFFAQKSLRLVDAKDAEKRDIFDELFNVSLDSYLNKAKLKVTEIETEVTKLTMQVSNTERLLDNLKQQFANDTNAKNIFEDQKKQRIDAIELDIKTLQDKINSIDIVEVVVEEVQPADAATKHSLELRKQGAENRVAALRVKEANIKLPIETCSVCGGPIKEEKLVELRNQYNIDKDAIAKEILDAEADRNSTYLELIDATRIYEEDVTKYSQYQKIMIEQNAAVNLLNLHKEKLNGEQKLLATVVDQKCTITDEHLANLTTHINSHTTNLAADKNKLDSLNLELGRYKYWATEGFTSKGLQAYIINAMLVKLNESLAQYGEKLGILVNLDMKMETKTKAFTIKITDLNGVEKTYQSLSGGERKRVDIIVSFALHDILNKQVSVMVVDELFEGLDEQGQDIAMNLIRMKAESQAVYLITHNVNTDLTGAKILSVKKVGNFTEIKK